jgi:DNA-binding response OmpR family regulator
MKQPTILVVEDEILVAMDLQESLQRAGYLVPDFITSVDTFMSSLVREKPDLVLMDINLGSFTDGVSAVQRMRILGDTPVIYLTAYDDTATKQRALTTQPVEYLIKPISEQTLYSAVERALKQ